MNKAKSSTALALRFGIVELTIAIIGLVFVRRQVYLSGQFAEMLLHWQEYALLVFLFIDGLIRGAHTYPFIHELSDKRRNRFMQFFLPFVFFLFVACSSLCDKLNTACIRAEWWRDAGLVILAAGIYLSWRAQETKPAELRKIMQEIAVEKQETNLKSESVAETNAQEATVNSVEEKGDAFSEGVDVSVGTTGSVTTSTENLEDEHQIIRSTEPTEEKSESHRGESNVLAANFAPGAEKEAAGSTNLADVPTIEEAMIPAEPVEDDLTKQEDFVSAEQVPEVPTIDETVAAPANAVATASLETIGIWNSIRYPERFAILIELIGISLTLSAWMPLLSIPGLIILFKWELTEIEALRTNGLAKAYQQYQERTWLLIPYVY